MKKIRLLLIIVFSYLANPVIAQETLPHITVKEFDGKIVVSWINDYKVPVSNINIQRSYDSTKNYTTIGSVLNPQNIENGYADDHPPYNKMYYRVFISFEGGSYVFSAIARPQKIIVPVDSLQEQNQERFPWQAAPPIPAENKTIEPGLPGVKRHVEKVEDPNQRAAGQKDSIVLKDKPEIIIYPSLRIYTSKDNYVVIHLPDADSKKYLVKFFDESGNFIFELNKLKEEYLIIEKVNFVHAGWFHFEIYESGKLVEKNKFFIAKDIKTNVESLRKPGGGR